MKLVLHVIGFSLVAFDLCSSVNLFGYNDQEMWEKAQKIEAQQTIDVKQLSKECHLQSSDYNFGFNQEATSPTQVNFQAQALVEYQRLLQLYGRCKAKTFHECVNIHSNVIPLNERCDLAQTPFNASQLYTPIDQYGNNVNNPKLGTPGTVYGRYLDAQYEDDINQIRKSALKSDLPNPRVMGNFMSKLSDYKYGALDSTDKITNTLSMMFTQMVAHDISTREVVTVNGNNSPSIKCCSTQQTCPFRTNPVDSCIPVEIPQDDPLYKKFGVNCQEYYRHQISLENNCKVGYTPQNGGTHFVDLSIIYGSSVSTCDSLRANYSGLFQVDSYNLFPLNSQGNYTCGDGRFSQTTLLGMMLSMFIRLHNVIAKNLFGMNPQWTDNQLFYEARRITMAIYQHIVYCEWLPLTVDNDILRSQKLTCDDGYDSNGYDPTVDPSSMMEFANAAFKVFHANIPGVTLLADASYNVIGQLRVSDTYFNVDLLKHHFDDYVRGSCMNPKRINRVGYTEEVRGLFGAINVNGSRIGVDLLLLDIMRVRDSGLRAAADYIERLFGKQIGAFDDLKAYFDDKALEQLQLMYKNVRDVDLLVALIFEKQNKNYVGQITARLMAEQFHRFKFGDRFFYSHNNGPYKFTPEQLKEIKKMTIATVICLTTSVEQVPYDGFITVCPGNPIMSCSKLGNFNFETFRQSARHKNTLLENTVGLFEDAVDLVENTVGGLVETVGKLGNTAGRILGK